MLQQKVPEDYVIATGRMETVRKFIEITGKELKWNNKNSDGESIIWEGEGTKEIGRRADTNEIVIKIDPKYFRPTEVDLLQGDSTKALKKLKWQPKTTLEQLIHEMVKEDQKEALNELILKQKNFDGNKKMI